MQINKYFQVSNSINSWIDCIQQQCTSTFKLVQNNSATHLKSEVLGLQQYAVCSFAVSSEQEINVVIDQCQSIFFNRLN